MLLILKEMYMYFLRENLTANIFYNNSLAEKYRGH